MIVRLVSHASVIVRGSTGEPAVWTDPWLHGRAFNESWALWPDPQWDERWLENIRFLWISHEHPDHLHFPTLKSLPEAWRRETTVLYQDRDTDEVCGALRRIGFRHFRLLEHREKIELAPGLSVYGYHAPFGDSCLAVRCGEHTALNVNDAQIEESDCETMRNDLGHIDLVLKQFSLAGYTGGRDFGEELPKMASSILAHLVDVHRWLGAGRTIPFASFVRFCSSENSFVNDYVNRPTATYDHLRAADCACALLRPGDEIDLARPFNSELRRAWFLDQERERTTLPVEVAPSVSIGELASAFEPFARDIRDKFPAAQTRDLPPLRIRLSDLDQTIEISLATGALRAVDPPDDAHLETGSQALRFAFSERYGFETLMISCRAFLLDTEAPAWRLNRNVLWLYRWRIWLAPKWLLQPAHLRRVWPWLRQYRLNARVVRRALAKRLRRVSRLSRPTEEARP